MRQLEAAFPHPRIESDPARLAGSHRSPIELLDLQTIVKISQAVSSEIVLEKLIKTLLVLALEHAGALRGLLILSKDSVFRIKAEATTGSGEVQVRPRGSGVTEVDLPESVMRYVIRTQSGVLLEGAATPNQFSHDP